MAATNHTENYNLPQYIGTDKPTYLGDWNSTMGTIDSQMKQNADNASGALSAAQSAQTNANSALTTAQGADSKADTALTNAGTAQSTADNATSVATSASSTANTANTIAQNAQTSADTANTAISSLASEVATKLAWTLLDTATGTTPITLPSDFNELMIHFDEVGTGKSYVFMFEKTMLTSSPVDYIQGGYISNNNCSQVALEITDSSVKISYAYQNGANDYTATSTITVFYR